MVDSYRKWINPATYNSSVRLSRKMIPAIFVSGACSLVYQTLWMRSFRLIFGASTMAAAAVVAMFMAGLGIGSYVLGKRMERRASVTTRVCGVRGIGRLRGGDGPALIWCIEKLYYATEGSGMLGLLCMATLSEKKKASKRGLRGLRFRRKFEY